VPKPSISVLLPVHDGERFVRPAVESVLAQTHSDLELVVVDDGSTDGTLAVLRSLAARDSRVRLHSRANRGLVESLNELVGLARAPWVARMDADDLCEPGRLARQLSFCTSTSTDVCGSAVRMFSDATSHVRAYPLGDADVRFQLALGSAFAHPAVFGRTACFREHPYRTLHPHAEDYDLWVRLALAGIRLGNVAEPLLRYRLSPGQVSRVHLAAQFASAAEIAMAYRAAMVARMPALQAALRSDGRLAAALRRAPGDIETRADLTDLAQLLFKIATAIGAEDPRIGDHLCHLARHNGKIPLVSLFAALAQIAPRDRAGLRPMAGAVANRMLSDRAAEGAAR
jgi:glycosyltransferase involved in cell wall biosynthesis